MIIMIITYNSRAAQDNRLHSTFQSFWFEMEFHNAISVGSLHKPTILVLVDDILA